MPGAFYNGGGKKRSEMGVSKTAFCFAKSTHQSFIHGVQDGICGA